MSVSLCSSKLKWRVLLFPFQTYDRPIISLEWVKQAISNLVCTLTDDLERTPAAVLVQRPIFMTYLTYTHAPAARR